MKKKALLITVILSTILAFFIILLMSKKINPILYKYTNIEVKRITNNIIVKNTKEIVKNVNLEEIFNINKNQNNEIDVVDFNTTKVNLLLEEVAIKITKELIKIENGKIKNIELPISLSGKNYYKTKKGIICEVPLGVLVGSDILANLGTNIPVRLVYSGKVNTFIDAKIQEYGINNAFISIDLIVEVQGRIVMPTTSKETNIKNRIPLLMRIINGKIPEYYQKGSTSNSQIYSLPIEE